MSEITETNFTCTSCTHRGMLLQTMGQNEFICEECDCIFTLPEAKYKLYLSTKMDDIVDTPPLVKRKETEYRCQNCEQLLLQTIGENEFNCVVCGVDFKLSAGKYAAYMSQQARRTEELLKSMEDKFRKPEEIWTTA